MPMDIEHSIIMEECKITGLKSRIEDSLIGKNVVISKSTAKPQAYRFMLGELTKERTIDPIVNIDIINNVLKKHPVSKKGRLI